MPLSEKGQSILKAMEKTYGNKEKAERVLYASANKGTITGIHDDQAITDAMAACADAMSAACDAIEGLNRRIDAYTARRADARKFPSHTTKELEESLARNPDSPQAEAIKAEIAARKSGESKPRITPQVGWGRKDEFHEQPAQDIRDDDRRVIGGIGHRLPP